MSYGVPRTSSCSAKIQRIELGHVLVRKFEIVHVRICNDSLGGVRLGQGNVALLQRPADEDLSARLADSASDGFQHWVIEALPSDDGAVGLNYDTVSSAVVDDRFLLTPGVEFDLRRARDGSADCFPFGESAHLVDLGDGAASIGELLKMLLTLGAGRDRSGSAADGER